MTLSQRLDEIRTRFASAELPEGVRETLDGHVSRLVQDGVAGRALGVGDRAPSVRFDPVVEGRPSVQLTEALEYGPVVLTWFRGSW